MSRIDDLIAKLCRHGAEHPTFVVPTDDQLESVVKRYLMTASIGQATIEFEGANG